MQARLATHLEGSTLLRRLRLLVRRCLRGYAGYAFRGFRRASGGTTGQGLLGGFRVSALVSFDYAGSKVNRCSRGCRDRAKRPVTVRMGRCQSLPGRRSDQGAGTVRLMWSDLNRGCGDLSNRRGDRAIQMTWS